MNGCRADRPTGVVLGAILLFLLALLPAAAQTGAPTPLTPSAPAPPASTPAAAPPPAPATGGSQIETAPLAEIVNDADGPLEGTAGLGIDLWRGTSRSLVETLIPQIPTTSSLAERGLIRRLLLTSATPPDGNRGTDLFRLRAERLMGLGYAADAASLLLLAPVQGKDPAAAAELADALLLAGSLDKACALPEQNPAFAADPAGERLQIFCAMHAGDRDHAYFLFDVMREQGPDDPAFASALTVADGAKSSSLPADASPSPIVIALLAQGKATPPDRWFKSADLAELPSLLAVPGSGEAKISAAERATRLGLVEPSVLASAYDGLDVSGSEREQAAAVPPNTIRRRAALHQAVQQGTEATSRGKLIAQALGMPVVEPLWTVNALLYAPVLRDLAPSPDLAAFAPNFARALFLAGEAKAARRWVMIARGDAGDPNVAATLPGLALLSALAGETDATWNRAARQLAEKPRPTPEGARLAAIAKLLPVKNAPPAESAPPAGGLFDPGLGPALRNAAAAHRVGETVMFSLLALGDRGPASADPAALGEALLALRRIGLESEVAKLATEAAVANGA
jgi:hypothetical protein